MSSRWSRVAVSARARGSSAASRATTRTACRRRPRRPRTIATAASRATTRRAAPCRRPSGKLAGPGEDCIACHMPRPAITNIPHTAATDHRIPRGAPGSVPEDPRDAPGQPADVPLMDYHWGLMTEEERRDAARDLGVALSWAARLMSASPPLARLAATQALPLLEAAVRDRPDDLLARESLGYALGILDRPEEALRAFEEVLRIEPGRELTLRSTGRVLARLQRPDLARAALREDDRGQPLALGLSPGAGPGLRPGRGLARGRRGLPRGDPAQPRAVRGTVAPGPVLPALSTSPRRPTPSSRPCSASTPPAARSGSSGTSSRNRRGRGRSAPGGDRRPGPIRRWLPDSARRLGPVTRRWDHRESRGEADRSILIGRDDLAVGLGPQRPVGLDGDRRLEEVHAAVGRTGSWRRRGGCCWRSGTPRRRRSTSSTVQLRTRRTDTGSSSAARSC